jgi:hypothetical protein
VEEDGVVGEGIPEEDSLELLGTLYPGMEELVLVEEVEIVEEGCIEEGALELLGTL